MVLALAAACRTNSGNVGYPSSLRLLASNGEGNLNKSVRRRLLFSCYGFSEG
jgi:hypothetical protein